MNGQDRFERWLDEMSATLERTASLAERGRSVYDEDDALPLAFEALSNRVGDLATRLVAADPEQFSHPYWRAAARHRDFVAHHYGRIDAEMLWSTVIDAFRALAQLVRNRGLSLTRGTESVRPIPTTRPVVR